MQFHQKTEDNPITMKMVRFMCSCDSLLKIVNVLDRYCDEDEYLEILYDNIQTWINESQEVLSQYDLEEMEEDLEFYKATQEALDRCDDSKKGVSVEEFLKELDSW